MSSKTISSISKKIEHHYLIKNVAESVILSYNALRNHSLSTSAKIHHIICYSPTIFSLFIHSKSDWTTRLFSALLCSVAPISKKALQKSKWENEDFIDIGLNTTYLATTFTEYSLLPYLKADHSFSISNKIITMVACVKFSLIFLLNRKSIYSLYSLYTNPYCSYIPQHSKKQTPALPALPSPHKRISLSSQITLKKELEKEKSIILQAKNQIPEAFLDEQVFIQYSCPITGKAIRFVLTFKEVSLCSKEPTLYEKAAITQWIKEQKDQRPPKWPDNIPVELSQLTTPLFIQKQINTNLRTLLYTHINTPSLREKINSMFSEE